MSKTALRRILTIGAALAATAALNAAPAQAAPPAGVLRVVGGIALFTASSGVTNVISTAGTMDHYIGIHDTSGEITIDPSAAAKCHRSADPHNTSVNCRDIDLLSFSLGDGNDTLYTEGYLPVYVQAGPGDDTVRAPIADAGVSVLGQDGNDTLTGGEGSDFLDAGPGVHQRTEGGLGTDTSRGSGVTKVSCERL